MTKKILIVDDEPMVLSLMEHMLKDFKNQGVIILKATNGVEALEIIQIEQPTLVFLDVMMPKMNGFEVCQMVKQQLKMDKIYIALLTAKSYETDRQNGYAVGANVYLTKPFRLKEIIAKVEEVLEISII